MTTTAARILRPVPDASMFRPPRDRQRWTTLPFWSVLTPDQWDNAERGSRRTIALVPGSVYCTMLFGDDGWLVVARHGLTGNALAGLRSAPRVLMDPDVTR